MRFNARNGDARVSIDLYTPFTPRNAEGDISIEFSSTPPSATDSRVTMHGTVALKENKCALISSGGLLLNLSGVHAPELVYGEDVFTAIDWMASVPQKRKRPLRQG